MTDPTNPAEGLSEIPFHEWVAADFERALATIRALQQRNKRLRNALEWIKENGHHLESCRLASTALEADHG